MIRVAILEKEPDLAAQIRSFISRYESASDQIFSVAVFPDEYQLVLDCQYCSDYHILIADPDADRESVFASLTEIRSVDRQVCLMMISGQEENAFTGYTLGSQAFLLKPFSYEEFFESFASLLSALPVYRENRFIVKIEDGLARIDEKRLLYVEAKGGTLIYHTLDGDVLSFGSLKEARAKLPGDSFYLIPHFFLLNLEHIRSISDNLIQIGDTRMGVSAQEKKPLLDALNQYLSTVGV